MRQRALCVIIVTILGAATFQACSPAGVPRQAEDLVAEARYDEAIDVLQPYLEEHPDDFDALIVLGDAYYLKGVAVKGSALYDPEAAEYGKRAIECYRRSRQIHQTRRSQDRESEASLLLSPP
jgi:hypothetical protein